MVVRQYCSIASSGSPRCDDVLQVTWSYSRGHTGFWRFWSRRYRHLTRACRMACFAATKRSRTHEAYILTPDQITDNRLGSSTEAAVLVERVLLIHYNIRRRAYILAIYINSSHKREAKMYFKPTYLVLDHLRDFGMKGSRPCETCRSEQSALEE